MQHGFTCGLFVTLVDDCNINCSFCPFPGKDEFRNGAVLDYKKFMKVLSDIRSSPLPIPLGHISLCGSGEPLLHKDVIQFVAEAKKCSPEVSIVTNGLLLDEAMSFELIRTGINQIVISITGNSADVYNEYQGNEQSVETATAQLNLIRSNVERLISLRNDLRGSTGIGISYILHEDSKADLFSALNYYYKIGVGYVDIRMRSTGFSLKQEDFEAYVADNKQLFDMSGGYCTCFGKVMNLSTDGTLRFCNCSYRPETIIGNVFESSLADILSSCKFVALKEVFHSDYANIPEYCKICDLGRARPILK